MGCCKTPIGERMYLEYIKRCWSGFGFNCADLTFRDFRHCVLQCQTDTGLCLDRLNVGTGHSSSALSKDYGHPDFLGILAEQKRYIEAYVKFEKL